jgi:hypothetical protein
VSIRVPLWVTLAACAGCLALGSVRAQAPKKPDLLEDAPMREYSYLPKEYAQSFDPSVADWQALRLTAEGASAAKLTEHFTRRQCTAILAGKGLAVKLDLVPEASWPHYAGGGKFKVGVAKVKPDLQAAAEAARDFTRTFFQEIQDKDLAIIVHIRGERVGLWNDGKLVLEAERTAQ